MNVLGRWKTIFVGGVVLAALLLWQFLLVSDNMAPSLKDMQSIRQVGMLVLSYASEHGGRMPVDIETLKIWAENSEHKVSLDDRIWIYRDLDSSQSLPWILGNSATDSLLVKAPKQISNIAGKTLRLVYHKKTMYG